MADKGAHPGVKSLLARFENNQQNTASPRSRDRSPAGSDNLSKVRASFVPVEGGSPSSPALGLRRVSPDNGDAPSPSRVKSFSSEDLGTSVKSNESSAQPTNGLGSLQKANGLEKKDTIQNQIESKGKEKAEGVSSADKENQPAPKSPAVAPAKPTETVSKKSSFAQVGKTSSATKSASQAPTKTSSQTRATNMAIKPSIEKTRARVAKSSTTNATSAKNDSLKTPVHKPSRTSLAIANKAPTRPAAHETTRAAVRSSDARSSSTARPARPTTAATTDSSTSALRSSTMGAATSTLSRKPSSLKSAIGTRQRSNTPTATTVRKPASRSPPSGNDRPHSRASTASRPVDEGFLARMMRPTASSASKAHEKLDVKSPPRAKVARAPRKIPSTQSTQSVKEKVVSKSPSEVEERPAVEPAEAQTKIELKTEPVRQTVEDTILKLPVEPSAQPTEAVAVEEKSHEATAEPTAQSVTKPVVEPTQPVGEHTESQHNKSDVAPTAQQETTAVAVAEPVTSVEEQVKPAKVTEPTPEVVEEKVLAPAAELVEKPSETTDSLDIEFTHTIEPTASDAAVASQGNKSDIASEVPLKTNQPDVNDIDLSKWSLNDEDDTF
ncbi:hypothetical protein BDW66DRAFT_141139 [Aspergillus desertorum]